MRELHRNGIEAFGGGGRWGAQGTPSGGAPLLLWAGELRRSTLGAWSSRRGVGGDGDSEGCARSNQ